jgi:hypothetical protein
VILADKYWWYAQRDWAIAVVLVVLIVSLTTILLYWWNRH